MKRLNRKVGWRVVLSLALLIGQAGAQMHAYAHVRPDSAPVDPPGLHTQPCNQCMSFAPLLAAASGASCAPHFDHGDVVRPLDPATASLWVQPRLHGFQSRAPPAHL